MIEQAKELASLGLSQREIGRRLGKHHTTIKRWLDDEYAQKMRDRKNNDYAKNKQALTWYRENREKALLYKKGRRSTEQYRAKAREYNRLKRQSDPNFMLADRLRSRLYCAIKGNFKAGSAVSDLGCSIEFLKEHLESMFQDGMSWDNQGEWHIDHIIPLASFDLQDREQFLKACHYTNLQPLWAEDNLRKGDKCLMNYAESLPKGW